MFTDRINELEKSLKSVQDELIMELKSDYPDITTVSELTTDFISISSQIEYLYDIETEVEDEIKEIISERLSENI